MKIYLLKFSKIKFQEINLKKLQNTIFFFLIIKKKNFQKNITKKKISKNNLHKKYSNKLFILLIIK